MAKGDAEMAALVAALDGDVEFEMDLGSLVGKFRTKQSNAIRDMEAARLLPRGRAIAAELLGVAPSTVYKMNRRHRKRLSTVVQQA